ncbi:hypothetical protein [Actinomyces israelii]|uniref:hypothetical protein n=1 Tax=Actinomyces israelii TaxID=1659 RepID=UPI0023579442|nr:hypothetical protein [Actinomyces israelii]
MMTTTSSATPAEHPPTTPALRPSTEKQEQGWAAQVQRAKEARSLGAELRSGKIKSFRPVVGRI